MHDTQDASGGGEEGEGDGREKRTRAETRCESVEREREREHTITFKGRMNDWVRRGDRVYTRERGGGVGWCV